MLLFYAVTLAGNELTFPSAEESNLWLIYNLRKVLPYSKDKSCDFVMLNKKAWIKNRLGDCVIKISK